MNVGLNYLSLSRSAETLSGGEAQRIRLASQIGAGLVGVMYVLDEPSIGLHQRDNERLLNTLIHLATVYTRARANINNMIGFSNGVFIMFHHDHGVTQIAQVNQRI